MKKIKNYLLLAFFTFLAFILPGIMFMLINKDYSFRFELAFLGAFIPAALILPLVRPKAVAIVILICFMLMELVQFSHLFYFNTPLNVFSLHLMMSEWGEIFESAKMALPWGLYHVIVLLVCYGGLVFLYIKIPSKKSFIATFLIVVLLSILPHKALFKTPRLNNFMPRNDSVSLYNSLKTFTAYFCIYLKDSNKEVKTYKPYEIKYIKNDNPINIVFILGESVNANHIGLLGYERDTTPNLSKLAKDDENFIAKKAISSSVLTKVSLPMMMNLAYHHDDIKHILSEQTHLFKLAKKAGFKTYYISDQTEAEATAMAPNYIDVLYTKESYPLKAEQIGDMILLEKLKEHLDEFKTGKNFIVFHQRNAHSPYEFGYRGYARGGVFDIEQKDNKTYKINSYDNAMIFNDYLIYSIFSTFKDSVKIPSYMLFTPDHGEAMGEINDGVSEWGHAFLSHNISNIPLFATAYHTNDLAYINSLKNINYPTHYEIGLQIAKLMGYEIINPEYKEDVFYINGVDIAGNAGYIKGIKEENGLKYEYFK